MACQLHKEGKQPDISKPTHPGFAQPASWLCLTPAPQKRTLPMGQPSGSAGREGPVLRTQQQGADPGKGLALFAHDSQQVSVDWTYYLQKDGLTPSCLTRFVGGGTDVCKILQDLLMADIEKIQSIILNTLNGEQAESTQSKRLHKRSLQLILTSTQSSHLQAMRPYSGDGGGHTANLAHSPHQTYMRGSAGSIRLRCPIKPQELCLQHSTRVPE